MQTENTLKRKNYKIVNGFFECPLSEEEQNIIYEKYITNTDDEKLRLKKILKLFNKSHQSPLGGQSWVVGLFERKNKVETSTNIDEIFEELENNPKKTCLHLGNLYQLSKI